MAKSIPTLYSSIAIDKDDFVFGTVFQTSNADMFVKKLNPQGLDILEHTKQNQGRVVKGKNISAYIDVCASENSTYSVLDGYMKSVYTYDSNGLLLYTFGSDGNEFGSFKSPVAIDKRKDGQYLVLDETLNQIVVFAPTEFGETINKAVKASYLYKYEESAKYWDKVLDRSVRQRLAYKFIGRAQFEKGEYKEALKSFKIGGWTAEFSMVFNEYRDLIMQKYFGIFISAVIFILVIVIFIKKIFFNIKKRVLK